jgi:Rps23 Pro-64 3,4-dihydroxylase Tpa1-like proline 4-hydroxylase
MDTAMGASNVVHAEMLNPRLQSDREALARAFRDADPFRHVVIADFFVPEVAQRLLDDFPAFDEQFAPGEMRRGGRKATRRNVRDLSDAYRQVDDFLQAPEFLNLMSDVTGIPDLLYDSEYHGGGTHENIDGAKLYTHVDFNYHPKGWHRRLNLIVYLSPQWEDEWGGNLELHSNPWDPSTDHAKTVSTKFNQAVLFETTEHSWHGFSQIRLPEDHRHVSRKSFAVYLYTNDRPADQTAASHSTIYVPFGIPDDIQPGTVLTAEQHAILKARFSEYRDMLKLQYDRQLRQSEEYRTGYRLDLQGYAVQTKAPTGRWPDTWVSSDFSMEFRATKPVRGLLLEISVPQKLESDQVLEIQAGDWSGTEEMHPGEERVLELPIDVDAGQSMEVAIHASTTRSPGGADTRQLAYRIVSAVLQH